MSTSAAEYHGPATTRSRYRSRTTKASSSSVSDELLEPSRSSSSSSSSDDSRSNTLSPSASNGDNDNKKDGHYGNDHENEHASSSSSSSFSILDIFRLLTGLLILNSALSYFVTNDSLIWGYKTHWLRPGAIQAWLRGPLELTPEQLLLYNGSAYPDLPIYLAVNGTVFDVSASPHHYGPGGGYHFFAGRDGARAFVTGCFMLEHVVPDLRGAEELYLPAATGPYTVEERKAAQGKVSEGVKHWEEFFHRSDKYFAVGKVVRPHGWLEASPRLGLCEAAERSRPKPKSN